MPGEVLFNPAVRMNLSASSRDMFTGVHALLGTNTV
jgi:hypothetical protein